MDKTFFFLKEFEVRLRLRVPFVFVHDNRKLKCVCRQQTISCTHIYLFNHENVKNCKADDVEVGCLSQARVFLCDL